MPNQFGINSGMVGRSIAVQSGMSPSTHLSKEEAIEAVKTSGVEWAKQLTQTQRSALRNYTDSSYANINAGLRGKAPFSHGNEEKAREIHAALSTSRIPNACTVYRGASNAALGNLQNLSDAELVGHVIRDGGFMSTSLYQDSSFSGAIQLEIDVPAGAHGAYLGSISEFPDENEVLFDAQQYLKITGVRRGQYGERIITAKMLI